jgi:hypothetical protein
MEVMGKYCKAYQVKQFRVFKGWTENSNAFSTSNSPDAVDPGNYLNDDAVLYLQEDLSVTSGIFKDEQVVFRDSSDEWAQFCRDELLFDPDSYMDVRSELS